MDRASGVGLVSAALVAGCGLGPAPSASPAPTAEPPVVAPPIVSILPNWTSANAVYTFNGWIEPNGSPTQVVLQAGHEAGTVEQEFVVGEAAVEGGPIKVAAPLGEQGELCVWFKATNEHGSDESTPVCIGGARPGKTAMPAASSADAPPSSP